MSSTRDYAKYALGGEKMGKARLVHALVKRYVVDHPSITFEGLREVFPDRLQAESPVQFDRIRCVVMRVAQVPEESRRRFFLRDEERIQLSDSAVVVSREWNAQNIQNVLARAEELGYRVTT